MMHSYLVIHKK